MLKRCCPVIGLHFWAKFKLVPSSLIRRERDVSQFNGWISCNVTNSNYGAQGSVLFQTVPTIVTLRGEQTDQIFRCFVLGWLHLEGNGLVILHWDL
eukprot:TsM_000200000 transcript=TsM_000200000 gene=TsM_000200000